MKNKDILNGIPEIHESAGAPLSYGYDPTLAAHLGIAHDSMEPSYQNIANHMTLAQNLDDLRKTSLQVSSEDTVKTAKEPSEALSKDPEDSSEEGVDETDDGSLAVESFDEMPKITDDMVDEAMSDLDGSPLRDIIKQDPSETRNFKDLLSRGGKSVPAQDNSPEKQSTLQKMLSHVSDQDHTHNSDLETLAYSMGMYSNKGELVPRDSVMKELSGVPNKNEVNDPHLAKLTEGLNRALNMFTRYSHLTKKKNNGALADPSELLSEMVGHLASGNNLTEEIVAYRKAGNLPLLDVDKKPEKRVRERNNRYMKMTFPKLDDYLAPDEQRKAQGLHRLIQDFMVRNAGKPISDQDRILIKTVSADWVKNSKPIGEGSTSAVVLRVGNDSLVSEKQVDALVESPKEETTKTASNVTELSEAKTWMDNFRIKGYPMGPSKELFEELFIKWLIHSDIQGYLKTLGNDNSLTNEYGAMVAGSKDAASGTIKEDSGLEQFQHWLSYPGVHIRNDEARALAEKYSKRMTPLANHLAKELYDLINYQIAEGNAKSFMTMLWSQLPSVMSRMLEEPLPDGKDVEGGINSWVLGNAMKQAAVSKNQVESKLEELIREMLTAHGSGEKGTLLEQWHAIYTEASEDPESNRLVTLSDKWGSYLLENGEVDRGNRFRKEKIGVAAALFNVIEQLLVKHSDGNSLTVAVEGTLSNMSGNFTRNLPRMHRGKKALAFSDKVNGNSVFQNMVFVSGDFKGMRNGMKPITPVIHKMYELVVGPLSFYDKEKKLKGEQEGQEVQENELDNSSPKFMRDYVLQVYDGRPTVSHEESRLSKEELPRFIEFVANGHINKDDIKGSNVDDFDSVGDQGEALNHLLDGLTADKMEAGFDENADPVYEAAFLKGMRGKTPEQRAKILELLDKESQGRMAEAMKRMYGSDYTIKDGEVHVIPSRAQEMLESSKGAPYHTDRGTEKVENLAKSLSKRLPSIKDISFEGVTDAEEAIKEAMKTREVSEEFLKMLLPRMERIPNSSLYPMYAEYYKQALKKVLIQEGMSSILELTNTTKRGDLRFAGQEVIDKISKAVSAANAVLESRKSGVITSRAYAGAWKAAKDKNPTQFNKLFKDVLSPSLMTSSTLVTEGVLNDLLLEFARNVPDSEKVNGFTDIVHKDVTGDWSVNVDYPVKNSEATPRKISRDDKRALVSTLLDRLGNNLLEAHGASSYQELSEITNNPMFEEVVKVPKASKEDSTLYEVRNENRSPKETIEFSEELLKFMKDNDEVGGIGHIVPNVSGSRVNWNNLKSGLRQVKFKIKNNATRKDTDTLQEIKPKGDEAEFLLKKRADNKLNKRMQLGMNSLLDHYKDTLPMDKGAQSLLSQGRDIAKTIARLERFERKVDGGSDLTQELIRVMKAAEEKLQMDKDKQAEKIEESRKQGKPYGTKVDYEDPAIKIKRMSNYLIKNWLHKKGLGVQEKVQRILQAFTDKKVKIPELEGNIVDKVLINVANATRIRPTPKTAG
jgi:hypothetical protein